jgi:hypothetical protein
MQSYVKTITCKRFGAPIENNRCALKLRFLSDVLATDGELFGGFDAHFYASTGAAQQCDLDRTVREQLRHGHGGVNAIRRLDDNRLIGSSAED